MGSLISQNQKVTINTFYSCTMTIAFAKMLAAKLSTVDQNLIVSILFMANTPLFDSNLT